MEGQSVPGKTQTKHGMKTVAVMSGVYFLLYIAVNMLMGGSDPMNAQQFSWLLLMIFSFISAGYLLKKHKFPSKKGIIASAVISAVFSLSIIVRFSSNGIFCFVNLALLFLASCASMSVFEKYPGNALRIADTSKKYSIPVSIAAGIGVGAVLSVINYFLAIGSRTPERGDVILSFLKALEPATVEEMAFRTVFYALCLSCAGGEFINKRQKIASYFMMVFPHVIPHVVYTGSLVNWLISVLILSLIFGLAFAVMQKKRDILSAMIAHGLVDLVRFIIFNS